MLYILTLTWNNISKLTKLKQSLLPALQNIDYTWIIKDNNSNDNTFEVASEWGDNIKVIKYPNNNQNFAAGTNYLFSIAKPQDNDLVLLLNNDVVFNDLTSLKTMIKVLNNDSQIGVVGARLLYSDSNLLQHAGITFNQKNNYPTHYRDKQKSDIYAEKNRIFQAVTGAVLLTKAEYYKNICKNNTSNIHGMDEKYHWAFDDVDLCLSIKYNLQKKIVYCGETNIFHESSASLKKNPANMLFIQHNLFHLREKWSKRYIFDEELYMKDNSYNLYK